MIELDPFINIVPEFWKLHKQMDLLLWTNPSKIHLYGSTIIEYHSIYINICYKKSSY